MRTKNDATDVVVVGGGLAGLIAAWELAEAGLNVRLFDGAGLGGRATTREINGYSFNLGPRGLYRLGALHQWLAEAKIPWRGARPQPAAHLWLDGEILPMPTTPWQLATSRFLDLRAKAQLLRFLARLPRLQPATFAGRPFEAVLDAELGRRPARLFIEALTRLACYFPSPGQLAADAAVRQLQRALGGGVFYLDGGWQSLVDGISAALRARGVHLEQAKVVGLMAGERPGVVLADGREIEADGVLLAVPLAAATRLAPPPLRARLETAAAAGVAAIASCLDVGLARLPVSGHHFLLGLDQPYYLSVHSASAKLAPPGKALIHGMIYRQPSDPTPRAARQAELESLLEQYQPGLRAWREEQQFLPSMTVVELAPTLTLQGEDPRPEPTCAAENGLYLAGDWVRSTAMLADAAADSARAAVRALLAQRAARREAA